MTLLLTDKIFISLPTKKGTQNFVLYNFFVFKVHLPDFFLYILSLCSVFFFVIMLNFWWHSFVYLLLLAYLSSTRTRTKIYPTQQNYLTLSRHRQSVTHSEVYYIFFFRFAFYLLLSRLCTYFAINELCEFIEIPIT